jgi:GT2 family glycosyltransferase
MEKIQIAVLMTCHNRRETVLVCLDALKNQRTIDDAGLQVYLVDAGSTDGTVGAVRERFPDVNLIPRDDSLFWCGGMRAAFDEAAKEDHDYYLWLNDDTTLQDHAVRTLLDTCRQVRAWEGRDCIIVGSTRDPQTGQHTYGGAVRSSRYRPIKFSPVIPSSKPQRCDTMNGNCVLLPREVVSLIGGLSPEFTHAMADTDYGLRAKAAGVPIWVAPKYMGFCERNPPPPWTNPKIPLRKRLEIMKSPKGRPPCEWVFFARRHTGLRWPVHWFGLYLRTLFPRIWTRQDG